MSVLSAYRSVRLCSDLIPSESDLIRRIDAAGTDEQISKLLSEVNHLMKSHHDGDIWQMLRRCRQKIYDRRRKIRNHTKENAMTGHNIVELPSIRELQHSQTILLNEVTELKALLAELSKAQTCDTKEKLIARPAPQKTESDKAQGFISSFISQLERLDGSAFARYFPVAAMLTIAAGAVSWFVADQVTPLYQAFNFEQPELAAWGAVGMAVGFSGIYGALSSRRAAMMCLLMALYEVLFIAAGTSTHEKAEAVSSALSQPELLFTAESLAKAKDDYEKKKSRFEDPRDEVFQNAWFEKKFLTPAWDNYSTALNNYKNQKSSELSEAETFGVQGFLKLLYRLAAVVLAMILTGLAVNRINRAFAFSR
ncbi:MAG: hypothetical protein H6618_09390 [Deltaproteobacteria bacterium]|nr:hypothetical protein [Deltaproteobacteria bacterium]